MLGYCFLSDFKYVYKHLVFILLNVKVLFTKVTDKKSVEFFWSLSFFFFFFNKFFCHCILTD